MAEVPATEDTPDGAEPPPAGPRPRRLLRATAWAAAVGIGLSFGASLYVQSPGFRGLVLRALNRELEGSTRGRITLTGLTQLGLSSAQLENLTLTDEHGQPLLVLDGVRVGFDPLELLSPWLPGSRTGLSIDHVRVDRSRVVLVADAATGELGIARALGKDRAPEPKETPSTPFVLSLLSVELGEVDIDVDHPALGVLDVRIDHVRGSADIGGDESEVSVDHFGVQVVQDAQRWLEGTGSFRLLRRGTLGASFHGFLRGTELDVVGQLDEGVLRARLDVPHALPDSLRKLWPAWPLSSPLAARVTAEGPFAALAVTGSATSDAGRLDLRGNANLEGPPRARLDVAGHALNARAFSPDAPETALEARAQVDVSQGEKGMLVVADVTTEPLALGTVQLPAARVSLRNEAGASSAHFRLGDARADIEGDAELAADGALDLRARVKDLSLGAFPQLGSVRGRGELTARARIAEGHLRGSFDGRLNGVETAAASVSTSSLRGTFDGALDALDHTSFDVAVDGDGVRLGPLRLEHARVKGKGPWFASRVQADLSGKNGARGALEARLGLRDEVRIDDLSLHWNERGLELDAHASELRPERGVVVLDRLALTGKAGSLTGSLQLAPGRFEVAAEAKALDTELLLRTLGVAAGGARGIVTGTATLSSSATDARGQLQLSAEKVQVQNLSWRNLQAKATLAGKHVDVDVDATDPSLGRLAIHGTGDLDGQLHEPEAWQRATGSGSVALQRLPLWPVGLVLSQQGRVKELDGRLDVSLAVERSDPSVLPDLTFEAKTEELAFALAPDAPEAPDAENLRFEGYAIRGSASIDGQSGHGAATVLITDEHGALVTTSGSLDLDLAALMREPGAIVQRLLQTPLDALVRLHPRPVSLLPPPLGSRDLMGSVEATLLLRGSLAEPTLSLAARGHELQGGIGDGDRAVDVTSVLEYTPNTGRLRGTADVVQSGKSLVAARVEGRVPNPFAGQPSLDQVELRAAAMLNGVPLELVPVAARERMEARLYGSVDVEAEPGKPMRQRAHLEISNLTAQGHALGNGRLTFENGPSGLHADLRIGAGERYLRANVRGKDAAAASDGTLTGTLVAREFDASSLSPLTSGLLSRLAGAMDADLQFSLRPMPGDDWYLGIDGKAKVTGGSAHIEELGLEVREIDAAVTARSTPEYTVLQIDPLSAKARSRTPNLKGDAELWLRGLRVANGEANLTLEEVPLSLKGVSRGIARGHVRARLERQPDHLQLEVKIPDLRVRLPASSTRTLIALDPNPDLHVLQGAEPPEDRPRDALLWKIDLDLGNRTRIQRGDLDVPLTGHPTIEYQYEIRPSGTIEVLPGGRITLFDQNFSIDRGVLTFVPDEPDNPRVDVTASWRAVDGTTVYVDVTGRAADATVLTRDDRGLQEVERFYLITGGAVPEGRELAAGSNTESVALGQTFSLGINELLRDSLGNVAVSIGTTSDDRASYSASVRLSEKLSFQGSFQPASESNLEQSTNDLTGTLDYRFSRRWSLRTELGTSGGAFDLLWSHRY